MQDIETDKLEQISWDSYNQLLLYGEPGRLSKIFARYELYKKTIDLPGDIVEGGVFKGSGVLFWAKLIAIFNSSSARKVVGFDTFEGFLDQNLDFETKFLTESDDDVAAKSATVEGLMKTAEAQGLQSRMELVAGDVVATIKKYTENNPGFRVSLLNVDFDTYVPTKAVLEGLYDRVVPGGVVVFDEYAVRNWGESNAVDEFIADKGITLQAFPWTHSPTAYFVKGA